VTGKLYHFGPPWSDESDATTEPESFVVKGDKNLSVKPKLRPLADGAVLVTFACGATSTITPVTKGSKTLYIVDGVYRFGAREEFSSLEDAVRAASERCRLELAPINGMASAETWRAVAKEVDRDVDAACKVLRKLLRERTGRDWSVTRGRGTAYSWIRIHSPPKRRCKFGFLSIEDQILLTAALGSRPRVHEQGESIRTECGVRGSYVFRIAGVGVPEDWHVTEPGWD
jgi:hypothetical protein